MLELEGQIKIYIKMSRQDICHGKDISAMVMTQKEREKEGERGGVYAR